MSESIVVHEPTGGLQLVATPAEAQRRLIELQQFVQQNMQKGEDYGTIPGTQKPSLLQPGAQKLAEIYGLGWRYEDTGVTEDWDRGLFVYRKKCVLFARSTGEVIGEGCGSCNSREDRYAWRWISERDLPPGVDRKSLEKRTKQTRNGPWTQYRLPNADLASLVNTIEKMACKRAFVAAVIGATRSSGIFTQDLEDMPHAAEPAPEAEEEQPPARAQRPPNKPDEAAIFVRECRDAFADAETPEDLEGVSARITARKKTLTQVQLHDLAAALKEAQGRVRQPADREPGED